MAGNADGLALLHMWMQSCRTRSGVRKAAGDCEFQLAAGVKWPAMQLGLANARDGTRLHDLQLRSVC